MLPRERAEQILAEHAAGKPVRVIAETYGHSLATVRAYVHGRRTPGEPATRADDFGPFAAYCRQRLADDPHLRTPALLAEVSRLGLRSGRAKFYRALDRHGIQPHPCPDCYTARISGFAALSAARHPLRPAPLPRPAAPVAGETLASFLRRLASVSHTGLEAVLEILPPWFTSRPDGTTTAGSMTSSHPGPATPSPSSRPSAAPACRRSPARCPFSAPGTASRSGQ